MTLVKFADCVVESCFPLGLPEADADAPDYELVFRTGQNVAAVPDGLLLSFDAFGKKPWRLSKPWLSLAKQGAHYLFRFHGLVDFLVLESGREIQCFPAANVPPDTITNLFLNHVMPRVLSQHGRLLLHASAVLAPSGVIAFLGAAGHGKSTLAASFCQQGLPAIADDCLVLKEDHRNFVVTPSCWGLRLWPETISALFGTELDYPKVAHYTDKRRLKADNEQLFFSIEPAPLRRIYVLATPETADAGAIKITALSPREATMALVNAAYRLDISDRDRLRKEFADLGSLAATREVWQLAFPRDLSLLPRVKAAILENLERD